MIKFILIGYTGDLAFTLSTTGLQVEDSLCDLRCGSKTESVDGTLADRYRCGGQSLSSVYALKKQTHSTCRKHKQCGKKMKH